jgi:hypothetical protein
VASEGRLRGATPGGCEGAANAGCACPEDLPPPSLVLNGSAAPVHRGQGCLSISASDRALVLPNSLVSFFLCHIQAGSLFSRALVSEKAALSQCGFIPCPALWFLDPPRASAWLDLFLTRTLSLFYRLPQGHGRAIIRRACETPMGLNDFRHWSGVAPPLSPYGECFQTLVSVV